MTAISRIVPEMGLVTTDMKEPLLMTRLRLNEDSISGPRTSPTMSGAASKPAIFMTVPTTAKIMRSHRSKELLFMLYAPQKEMTATIGIRILGGIFTREAKTGTRGRLRISNSNSKRKF